mmetsp:Transcript_8469/g.25634  ORF Transcript_8469/g.25634 Transcript_8469/m.25634 type:complete len:241 (+) Transcript_8469:800-1522(+)
MRGCEDRKNKPVPVPTTAAAAAMEPAPAGTATRPALVGTAAEPAPAEPATKPVPVAAANRAEACGACRVKPQPQPAPAGTALALTRERPRGSPRLPCDATEPPGHAVGRHSARLPGMPRTLCLRWGIADAVPALGHSGHCACVGTPRTLFLRWDMGPLPAIGHDRAWACHWTQQSLGLPHDATERASAMRCRKSRTCQGALRRPSLPRGLKETGPAKGPIGDRACHETRQSPHLRWPSCC